MIKPALAADRVLTIVLAPVLSGEKADAGSMHQSRCPIKAINILISLLFFNIVATILVIVQLKLTYHRPMV
jgi:hypothetical protein